MHAQLNTGPLFTGLVVPHLIWQCSLYRICKTNCDVKKAFKKWLGLPKTLHPSQSPPHHLILLQICTLQMSTFKFFNFF